MWYARTMDTTSIMDRKIREHNRSEHSDLTLDVKPDDWTREQRIAARESCPVCRLIFTAEGGWRAERSTNYPSDPRAYRARLSNSRPARSLMTEAQARFLKKLVASRELTPAMERRVAEARAQAVRLEFTQYDASLLIDSLKELSWKDRSGERSETPRRNVPDVAEGRYALRDVPGYSNAVSFFKVDRPKQGPFKGRTFVSIFASDEKMAVRWPGALKILELIAADPRGAMVLYGTELGKCGHCGRTLTDDDSRAQGIGPVCARKMGW